MKIISYALIKDNRAMVDGIEVLVRTPDEKGFLTALYKALEIDYRKFYKMDNLSKLGFLGAELLLKKDGCGKDTAVILWNDSSSLDADRAYQKTIADTENYFPSPADFVYTLPNIVTGEIAIRHSIHGQTSFYVAERFDPVQICRIVENVMVEDGATQVLCGWTEYGDQGYEAVLFLVGNDEQQDFNENNITKIYKSWKI